ncbi:hypothetical protein [Solitalea koreensis]|uniref:Lipoprotein n=1 Tax=Solitalea koreensis TaxID=543615 RepID=A0A521AGU0_9SPHI|nr:hypothetical protein [Solitalea koreensis]SMO33958.1 hypothetical protein SAMN06265350_101142 [Solitalea koreensis]
MKTNFCYALLVSIIFVSCQNEQKKVIASDQISLKRTTVNKEPVAVFEQKYTNSTLNNDLNDWRFSIKLYETPKTFWYKMVIVDKELEVRDTVVFPDLGMEMIPALKKGHEPNSCLVGFLDKQGNFMEYKKVVSGAKGLKIKQTQSYYLSSKKAAE